MGVLIIKKYGKIVRLSSSFVHRNGMPVRIDILPGSNAIFDVDSNCLMATFSGKASSSSHSSLLRDRKSPYH